MKITGFEISQLSIALKKPFITALRRVDTVNDIIIKVHSDSKHVGYGEACAVTAITGMTNKDVINDLEQTIFPYLLQEEVDTETIFKKLYAMDISSEAKACVDIALYDLLSKQRRQSLHKYLGSQHSTLQTDLTISVDEPSIMYQDALKAVKEGFSILKVKLDQDIDKNITRLEMINKALSPSNRLRLDPNQSLTLEGCIRMISSINMDNIECIEQPFAADDLLSMKRLRDSEVIPLLADESIFTLQDAKEVMRDEIADMLNIKLMKCGGIYEAISITKLAKEYDKSCMIGSMLEGPISLLAAAHFGLSQENISMADLDSPLYLQEHPLLEPFHIRQDNIRLDGTPGLGIDKIMDKLALFN